MSNLSKHFSKTLQMGSSEDFDQICDLCLIDGKRMEAVVLCVECREYLCRECRNFHKKSSASKHHILQEKATMSTSPKGRKQSPGSSGAADPLTDRCQKHPDEKIKFYCNSHHQLGCSVCVTLHHGDCKGKVSYIREISSEITHSTEFKKVSSDAKKLVNGLKTSKSQSEQCRLDTDKNYDQTVTEVKMLRRDVNQLLDKLEESILNKASRQRKEYLDSVTHQEQRFDDLIKDVNEIRSEMDRKGKLKHFNQLFIAMKYAKEKLSALEIEAIRISQTIKPQRFVFNPDGQLVALTSSLTSLGTLSLASQPETAKYLHDIKVKTSTDTSDCYIGGAVVLKDGRLAMADKNNECVKIMDLTEKTKYQKVTLTAQPRDITVVGENQLAVTFYAQEEDSRIQFLSLSPILSPSHIITGPGHYRGLTYNGGKLFLCCFAPVPSIHIFDMSGNLLQEIDSDNTGIKLFKDPTRITSSGDKGFMYVSDWICNKVVCLNSEGGVMATCRNDMLAGPVGITMDQYGCVYICNYLDDSVIQLSSSGQLGDIVIKEDKIMRPLSITYSTGRLYISCLSNNSRYMNRIKVYKLE